MEWVRETAQAWYERASDKEKEVAEEFFRKLDVNGDGNVSLQELKKSLGSRLSNENVFKQLDENGDGTLDFFEVLAVYYMENKVDLPVCRGCWGLLSGPYFSCWQCLRKGKDRTFELCCACYRSGKIAHEHSSSYLLDHHSLLSKLRNQPKREMEELRDIATAYYRAGSREVQAKAYEFYQSMDADGNGRVDLREFLEFMRQQGYSQMCSPHFFCELDLDGNDTLDFNEVMTLYYIVKSGRPFCDVCERFIPGTFFSCVECYKTSATSFNLCRGCYPLTNARHDHGGGTRFLDNYTLLEATRNTALAQATGVNPVEKSPPPSNANNTAVPVPQTNIYMNTSYHTYNTYVAHPPTPISNHSNAIVPAARPHKWELSRFALQAFEYALLTAHISGTLCTIL